MVLDDLAAGDETSRLKRSTPPPQRSEITMSGQAGTRPAHLYQPGEAPLGAIVVVPGVAPQGRYDPRLVSFAETLARARFLVLVPELENLRELQVEAADAVPIADAAQHLAEVWRAQGGSQVGLFALSYAVGPSIIAVQEHGAADAVGLLLSVGGYYDLTAVITYFTTGWFQDGAEWRQGQPNEYGKWVFVLSNAPRLQDRRDANLLADMARMKLQDLRYDVSFLTRELGPEGSAVMALMDNTDPAAVPRLIAALPAPVRAEIEALDLARRDLSGLDLPAILIHGRDDSIIPFTESRALAQVLGEDPYLVDNLDHVDPTPPGMGDAVVMWRAVLRLLNDRDNRL